MRTLEIRKYNIKETRRWLSDRWEMQDMETNNGYLEALNIESSIKRVVLQVSQNACESSIYIYTLA